MSRRNNHLRPLQDPELTAFGTHAEAERAGCATFGLGPLYIKQVLADEPSLEVSRLAVQ